MKPKGLKGKGNYKHKPLSAETKRKISETLKKHTCYQNKERSKNISKSLIGRKQSKETKDKIAKSMVGNKNMDGKEGENHNSWKGEEAGYTAKHIWIYKQKGKARRCLLRNCKTDVYHWANVSGKYLRKLDDYVELCPVCHSFCDRFKINIDNALILKRFFAEPTLKQIVGEI